MLQPPAGQRAAAARPELCGWPCGTLTTQEHLLPQVPGERDRASHGKESERFQPDGGFELPSQPSSATPTVTL